ncbi:DUF2510 domain-containing protein [Yinghuangia aomiensis]|uniref:DUF2510 domain-containing protein n=1 Tax=Yinghuangia aomiensis TaxID=676205 RepID=A0ABP9H8D1_9ACTN
MATDNRPSGWYSDPSGQPDMLRWWNGTAWTDDFRPQSDFLQTTGEPQDSANSLHPPQGPQPPFTMQESASQPTVAASSAPWPGADRPIPAPVTPVRFEAVEPDKTRTRVVALTVAVVLAAAAGIGGYFLGTSGKSDDKAEPSSTSTSPVGSTAPGDVNSPQGFAGTALAGGKQIPGGQVVTGPKQRVTFSVPAGWTPQVDPKATSEEARYVLSSYPCTGRTGGVCTKGTVVQNLRLLSGGWSDLKSLALGMGQELITVQSGGTKPPGVTGPLKQAPVQIQGLDGYLALWDLPMVAGQTAPSSYCGILTVRVSPSTSEIAVLEMCLDRTADAPPVSLMDEIANSVRVTA